MFELIFIAFKSRFFVLLNTLILAIFTYNFFSVDDRGYLTYLLSITGFLSFLSYWPDSYIQKQLSSVSFNADELFFWYVIKVVSIIFIALSFVIVYLFFNFSFANVKSFTDLYIIFIFYMLTVFKSPVNESVLLGLFNFKVVDWFNYIKAFVTIFSCGVCYFLSLSSFNFFVIFISLTLFSEIILSWYIFKLRFKGIFPYNFNTNFSSKKISSYFASSYSIQIMTFLYSFSGFFSVYLIGFNLGFTELAKYSLYLSLFSIVFSFSSRLESYFLSILSRDKYYENNSRLFLSFLGFYFYFNALILALWRPVSEYIISNIFGDGYLLSEFEAYLFFVFFIIKPFGFVRNFYYINDKSNIVLRFSIIKYILEFTFLWFLSKIGVIGVTVATILSLLPYYFLMYKNCGFEFNMTLKDYATIAITLFGLILPFGIRLYPFFEFSHYQLLYLISNFLLIFWLIYLTVYFKRKIKYAKI